MSPACQLNEVKALLCAIARALTGPGGERCACGISDTARAIGGLLSNQFPQRSATVGKRSNGQNNQAKVNEMKMKLTVFKEVHNTWPAKNGKPAGESYDLLCMDHCEPPEYRMEEMLYYRTKDEERPRVWGKSVGTTNEVGVSKIRHGDNGGKATLLGSIIFEPKK